MSATAVAIKTNKLASPYEMNHKVVVKTGESYLAGTMVCLDTSGEACDPDESGALFVAGVAKRSVSVAVAGQEEEIEQGIFYFVNGGSFTKADRGKPCYAADNQTVDATSTNPVAGVIYDVDSVLGVAVMIDFFANRRMAPIGAAGSLTYSNGNRFVNLAIGTANQQLEVNAGATAPEWDTDN
jgi:hypothetical protein